MRSVRLVLVFAALLGLAAVARAEDYYLPHVANGNYGEGSFRTSFVFFNTNDTAVTVRLTLTNDQGGPLSMTIPGLGTSNDFQFTLQPGASRIVQTDGSGNLVVGAAHVTTSAEIGVSAIFTVYGTNAAYQTEAGVGNSEGLTDFVLPVDVSGLFNTGFALYDVTGSGATVTVRLINASGTETASAPVNLGPRSHTAKFVTDLFPGTSNFHGTLRITSSRPIAAVGLRQNQTPLSYTSLPAVARSAGSTEITLAHVANGSFGQGSFKTTFLIFNTSASVANVTLTLTKDTGTPFPVTIPGQGTNSTFALQLAPGASEILQTDGSGSLTGGAATITSNVPVGASAIFTVVDPQGRFQTEAGVGDSPAMTEMSLPVDVTGSFNTGIALYVPGDSSVTVNMKLLDPSGAIVATAQPLLIPAKFHTAKFVTELFPGTSEFQGSIAITATGEVSALTLREHSGPLSYTTLPVVSGASQGTQPQAAPLLSQTRTGIAATSDATLNQTLPGGFRLSGTISGTVLATEVLAKSGSNVFSGTVNQINRNYLVIVPAGTYQITVCCTQGLSNPSNTVLFTYTEPGSVQVSGDTQHNITVPSPALFDVSGTVTGLPTVSPLSLLHLVFTSADKSAEGTFTLGADGSYQGQLPNGSYIASVQILNIGTTDVQSISLYNIGSVNVNSAAVAANFTAPATARLSGTVRIAGTPVTTQGSTFIAQDRSAGVQQATDCISAPTGSLAFLDPAGAYSTRLVTNRTHGILTAVPVFKGSTTVLAGGVMYPALTQDITLTGDSTFDFNLPALPGQVRLTGKVTDSGGRAVSGVTVSAYSTELSGAANLSYSGAAQTDAAGNYELVLLNGTNYQVVFVPPTPQP